MKEEIDMSNMIAAPFQKPPVPEPAPVVGSLSPSDDGKKAEVFLPVYESNPGDDVLEICLNGRNYIIQRGVRVVVPLALAEVLEHSDVYATIRKL
jgi:hypothetical protein